MPTPQELELLELLAQEQRRNGSQEQTRTKTASALPELTPDMLLSAAARREMEAAQMLSGSRMAREVRTSQAAVRRDASVEMAFSDEMGDLDLDGHVDLSLGPQVTSNDADALSSLFMGGEAREAVQALQGGNYAASGYDIEFDADSFLEGRTQPNEAARFQVGRQSPPRMPFSAGRVSGPSDGVVVSSRSGRGSWERTAAAQPGSVNRAFAAIREQATMPREAPPPRTAPTPAPRSDVHRPTVYENILRGGLLGDD